MPKIRLQLWLGENRALEPTLLSEGVGAMSRNQKPGRGDFRPWKVPLTVATVPAGRKSMYRMGRDVASDANYWQSWTGKVDAVRGFEAEDTTERTYYTGDGVPKVTDSTMALAAAPYPAAWRPLGLPKPAAAPAVTVLSSPVGTGSDVSYYYVYTFVNDWNWESAPSPVSAEVVRKADQTCTVQGFAAPPSGNYQINRIRIYRTQTGASGATEFFFLREIALGESSTTDDNRQLREVLPTATWSMPPADLHGMRALWNGMLAGISGNAVRFCEPYTPYAWPVAYDVVPPDSKPVGIGYFGQQILVLTTGRPLLLAGSGPDLMDQSPVEMPQACVSADSIVSMGSGVAWASNDGLCWFGAGGAKILTAGVMTREDWQALRPASMTGLMYEGLYFGSYDDGAGRKGFLIDPANPTGLLFLDVGFEAAHFDELQDQLYVLDGTSVKRWDAGSASMTALFRSKVFRVVDPICWVCAQVFASQYPVTLVVDYVGMPPDAAQATAQANPLWQQVSASSVRYTALVEDEQAFRLPDGVLANDFQIQIQSEFAVQSVVVATSMAELKS